MGHLPVSYIILASSPCTDLLQCVWDPLSTSQTKRAVALIRRLADDYPTVSAENETTQVC